MNDFLLHWTHRDLTFWIVWFVIFWIYQLAYLIAEWRDHVHQWSIFVVNLFLGWTVIGWIYALAWACSGNTKK